MQTLSQIEEFINNKPPKTPSNFKIVALVIAYNEEDIIIPFLKHLFNNGIHVHILENWSTDKTFELIQQIKNNKIIGIERFPKNGSKQFLSWKDSLKRKEELAKEIDASWFMHSDVDNIRTPPWEGISLRDAIYFVDNLGFNAIDSLNMRFCPIDNKQIEQKAKDKMTFFMI